MSFFIGNKDLFADLGRLLHPDQGVDLVLDALPIPMTQRARTVTVLSGIVAAPPKKRPFA
jgi:hypothetical protein